MHINFKNSLLSGDLSIGVECICSEEDDFYFRFCTLKNKNKNIEIISFSKEPVSFDQLVATLPKNVPIVVGFTGSQIIHKHLKFNNEETETGIINGIFPNAKISDFYMNYLVSQGNELNISLIRRKLVDETIAKFKTHGYIITNYRIGFIFFKHILNLLKIDNLPVIKTGEHELNFENTNLISEKYQLNETTSISLGPIEIKSFLVYGFSLACIHFYPGNIGLTAIENLKNENHSFRYKIRILKTSKILGSILISITILSFIIQYILNNNNTKLLHQIRESELLIKDYETSKKQVQLKSKLLFTSGLLNSSKTAFYSDQIANNLPENISLKQLKIQPCIIKDSYGTQEINFASKIIFIDGFTDLPQTLNDWTNNLRNLSWVSNITLIKFNNELDGSPTFNLQIMIK